MKFTYRKLSNILYSNYCEIIIVREGLMFTDFVGYPYQQIYVHTNVLQSNELSCIVMQQTRYPPNYDPMNQQNFANTRTLAPTNK